MIQTPSKNLSREFLRELLRNRCLSASGVEYCEAEVKEALIEKESRLADQDFNKILREERPKSALLSYAEQIVSFQDQVFAKLKPKESARESPRKKIVSSVYAPSLFNYESEQLLEKKIDQRFDPITTNDKAAAGGPFQFSELIEADSLAEFKGDSLKSLPGKRVSFKEGIAEVDRALKFLKSLDVKASNAKRKNK